MPVAGGFDLLVGAIGVNWRKILMTQASLQIDFRPRPRGIAVVTSVPISSIIENNHYSVFQDLVDGYASSFAKVVVVSPSGNSAITAKKADRISWLSGPGWLSPTNGLWWAVIANRHELRSVDLVRTFGPRAGTVGRALTKFSNSQHVSSADDLAGNSWRDKTGWRALIQRVVNGTGLLRADVLSATLDWELEYLAETGYVNDLLLGSTGLPTDIYSPVGTTDPGRHPVVLWAGNLTDDSASLISDVACSTKKMIPDVEFVVVAEGDAADRLRSTSAGQGLPVRVASHREVEPLVDLVERTWACVTVPDPRRRIPHGLAMLALSAGKPLISLGELAGARGFRSHLNYICVERADAAEVAYGLQLLRRWSSFALRIGSAGQRLVDSRFSTRAVGLVEGEQLARIAAGLGVDLVKSDAARAVHEFATPQPSEDMESPEENRVGGQGPDLAVEASATEEDVSEGFDLVAAAIAAANGEIPLGDADDDGKTDSSAAAVVEPDTGDVADERVQAVIDAMLSGETGSEGNGVPAESDDSSVRVETIDGGDIDQATVPEVSVISETGSPDGDGGDDEADDDLPQIKLGKVNIGDTASESIEETVVAGSDTLAQTGNGEASVLDQDAISALFADDNEDDNDEDEIAA